VQSRFVEVLKSAPRQIVCIVMVLFGSLLAASVSVGPCAGTALAIEPFPAILVAIFGLELILCSYFLVKKLKVESDFRLVIYLFLTLWSLSLLFSIVDIIRSGMPRTNEEIDDFYFSLLRGFAAVVNLILFYRWVGAKNMITRLW
jgi:hypothetical protein